MVICKNWYIESTSSQMNHAKKGYDKTTNIEIERESIAINQIK